MNVTVNPEGIALFSLLRDASLIVQLVMALLLAASIAAWTMIFRKAAVLKAARNEADSFESRFWTGTNLNPLYKELSPREDELTGMERLFVTGFREYARFDRQGMEPMHMVEGVQRAMRVALTREQDRLEHHLPFLATVGSTSPYIGLFGTVWGIMNSFRALGGLQQATLAHVAPGIAEALIATAMGLFAAIPAVIAYNRYASQTERLLLRYEAFVDEFASLVQRQSFAGKPA
jgi:biopolymer transport protein TolQ